MRTPLYAEQNFLPLLFLSLSSLELGDTQVREQQRFGAHLLTIIAMDLSPPGPVTLPRTFNSSGSSPAMNLACRLGFEASVFGSEKQGSENRVWGLGFGVRGLGSEFGDYGGWG